jgi:hypothetical protein
MNQAVQSTQDMMRELVIAAVEKFNRRVTNNNVYNEGIAHAYGSTLSSLYNQAQLFHIPLNYLSLHTIDPEKASFSKGTIFFDKNIPIPLVKDRYQPSILLWFLYNIPFLKEIYEDCLLDADKDEFYKAVVKGYEEIFLLMKKYGCLRESGSEKLPSKNTMGRI